MAGTGNGGRTPKKPTPQNGTTRPFSTVNYRDARLAKEKQRRQYEQQKKEKIVFALFVVIIIVLILVAILVFKNAIDRGEADETSTPAVSGTDTTELVDPPELDLFLQEMRGKEQIHAGSLIFVDATHTYTAPEADFVEIYSGRTKFPSPSGSSKPTYSYYTPDIYPKLSAETLTALNKLADDFYNRTGNNDLFVSRAYDASATGDHVTGLAFDLSVYTIDGKHYALNDAAASSDFEWVFSNYYKYGFVMQTPEQSGERYHHLRYVGIPAATYMYENNVGLGDFLKALRDEHAFAEGKTNALKISATDGASYEMYYVEATGGDMTSVPVPEDALFFEISGDNQNGFVVTVRMN